MNKLHDLIFESSDKSLVIIDYMILELISNISKSVILDF